MKLALVSSSPDGAPRLAVALGNGALVDLAAATALRHTAGAGGAAELAVSGVKTLLTAGEEEMRAVADLVAWVEARRARSEDVSAVMRAESDVVILAPIPDAGKVLCVGKNYRDHLDELARAGLIKETPREPTGFIKLNSVLVGQDAEVARPEGIVTLDYEPELAFVIARPAYRVDRHRAMDYVAGVTLFNDLTAREIQKREVESGTRFWTAKNMPGFGPIGPYVVTLDDIADVDDLWISCHVNGEPRSRFNTSGQIFKIPDIIEHFSRFLPLEPGDIFATGSAAGVAMGQADADRLYLKPGDLVEVALEGVMSLRTRIV